MLVASLAFCCILVTLISACNGYSTSHNHNLAGHNHGSETNAPQNLVPIQNTRGIIFVFTDPETNCEYISNYSGGITPRLNLDGTHKCSH